MPYKVGGCTKCESYCKQSTLGSGVSGYKPQRHRNTPLSAELDGLLRKEGVTDKLFHHSSPLVIHHGVGDLSKPILYIYTMAEQTPLLKEQVREGLPIERRVIG